MDRRTFLAFIAQLFSGFNICEVVTASEGATSKMAGSLILGWIPRSDWRSVKQFGAVGNGVSDDTLAIQAAFDTIALGTTIYFPQGQYRVTKTLQIKSPNSEALYGVSIIGAGDVSVLVWDGEDEGTLIREEGMGYSRWIGLTLDGANRARYGQHHYSDFTFETVHRKQLMTFRNFTDSAVFSDPNDKCAIAETSFENCRFFNVKIGASFRQFNDYDLTFDGCEFRACGIGIECIHGNYYIRNCLFFGSRVVDIYSRPEHGCSVRRCRSEGSAAFIHHDSTVAPLTVENCEVSSWRNLQGAIIAGISPLLIFDNKFSNPPTNAKHALLVKNGTTSITISNNRPPSSLSLIEKEFSLRSSRYVYEIATPTQESYEALRYLNYERPKFRTEKLVFDAKRDFGAKGDGITDDSQSIQNAIDQARMHGDGAIAYMPSGNYAIKSTLKLTGENYIFAGAGMRGTHLLWQGAKTEPTILIFDADKIIAEHFNARREIGIDILHLGASKPCSLTYDGIFVTRSNSEPLDGGLHIKGLPPGSKISIPCMCGTLRVTDCSQASILVSLSYYGSFIIEGPTIPSKSGSQAQNFIGALTRFSHGEYNIVIRDNRSFILSDFYSEQSKNIVSLKGLRNISPGRVTIQGQKFQVDKSESHHLIEIENYAGEATFVLPQFYGADSGSILMKGNLSTTTIVGGAFYGPTINLSSPTEDQLLKLGSYAVGPSKRFSDEQPMLFSDSPRMLTRTIASNALYDLRRLGQLDIRVNHPEMLPKNQ